jgi:hypothetical protein
METDGNGSLEESASGIGCSGLEACGDFDLDALVVLEEGRPGIEWDSTPERQKGDGGRFAARVCTWLEGHGGWGRCHDALDDARRRRFRAFFDPADEVHEVASSAGREAVPQAAAKMSSEGGGMVAVVERAWPHQLVAVAFEASAKVVNFEHPPDADPLFEVFEELSIHAVSFP